MQLSNRNPSSGVLTNQTEFVLIKIVFAIFTSGFQPGSADTATPIFIKKKKSIASRSKLSPSLIVSLELQLLSITCLNSEIQF